MNLKALLGVFWSVFLAELGDKTQIATLCFASQKGLKPGEVFLAAASALILSSLLAVLLGVRFGRLLPYGAVRFVSGAVFLGIGIWTLLGR